MPLHQNHYLMLNNRKHSSYMKVSTDKNLYSCIEKNQIKESHCCIHCLLLPTLPELIPSVRQAALSLWKTHAKEYILGI